MIPGWTDDDLFQQRGVGPAGNHSWTLPRSPRPTSPRGGHAARERRRLLTLLRDAGVPGDLEAWVTAAEQALLTALDARGEATASELAGDDPRLAQPVVVGAGSKWTGTQNVASRLLLIMATEGQVIRGRPRGSWLSQGYRWTTAHAWCPGGFAEWDHEAAEAELARCWLAAFGPAPAADLQWWAGWTKTQTRRALAAIGPAEVELEDGGPGYALAGGEEPAPAAEPWAALSPKRSMTSALPAPFVSCSATRKPPAGGVSFL